MKLLVRVLEARNLAAKDLNGFSDPYVRVTVGKSKAKSATIYKNLNPVWNEELLLTVHDPESEILHLEVWDEDFFQTDDFLGKLDIPLSRILSSEEGRVEPTWYTLEKKNPRSSSVISGWFLTTNCPKVLGLP